MKSQRKSLYLSSMITVCVSLIVLFSPSLSAQSTSTIEPTKQLENLDVLETFKEHFTAYPDCILPCWWNFVPGKSKVQDLLDFLHANEFDSLWEVEERLETTGTGAGSTHLQFRSDENDYWDAGISISFRGAKGNLKYIELYFDKPNLWLLPELSRLTFPNLMNEIQSTPELYIGKNSSLARFQLVLHYPTEGTSIYYELDMSHSHENNTWSSFNLCPDPERIENIWIWAQVPTDEMSIDHFMQRMSSSLIPLSEGLTIGEAEFLTFFQEKRDACLPISFRLE